MKHTIKNRKTTLIICQYCNKPAYVRADGRMKYCSQSCVGKSQRKRVSLVCNVCGKLFDVLKSATKNSRRKFCSKACMTEWQKGKRSNPKTEFKKGHIPKNKNIPHIALKNNKRVCKICGAEKKLSEFSSQTRYAYNKTYICKACNSKQAMVKYYSIPESERSRRTVPILTNSQRIKNHKKAKLKYAIKSVKRLSDSYIKSNIRRAGLKNKNITPQMIELKRELLTFHRLKKEVSNGINSRGNKRTEANGKAA